MKVSMDGESEVVIIFSDDELEDFKKLAMLQGLPLPGFVAKAVKSYYRLCRDLIDTKGT